MAMSWMSVETSDGSNLILVCHSWSVTWCNEALRAFILHRCFCGSTPDPKPPRLATPHSCASPCTRSRTCGHSCPLACHPGPCPPCQVTLQLPCHCGKQTLTYRCSNLVRGRTGYGTSLSCGHPCGKPLDCGNHACEESCHDGPCTPCKVRIAARCYCGQTDRELACGEGAEMVSVIVTADGEQKWNGRFECDKACNRYAYSRTWVMK